MIANPTDHSFFTQRTAHGRIGVASQAPLTEFRQVCGGYPCPNNMHLYPNPGGGAKAGSWCGPDVTFLSEVLSYGYYQVNKT